MIAATIISARLSGGGGGGGGGGPVAPVASFTEDSDSPFVGQRVHFTDTSTGNPTSWQWTNNGTVFSYQQNPTLVFTNAGVYMIILTATNAFGSNTSAPQTISVGNS